MSSFHCIFCGQRIFRSDDIEGKQVLLEVAGYSCTCYNLKEGTDLSALKHRDEEFLTEVWCCCRISVVHSNRGGRSGIIAYTDSLVEVSDGMNAPAPVPSLSPRRLTELDFDKVIFEDGAKAENASTLYVVRFSALWCPPCRIMDQLFRDIAAGGGLPGVELFEVDSDQEQDLTDRFLAPSVPYTLFFKGGKKLDASRFTLKAVNGGIAEAMGKNDFIALCQGLLSLNG